MQSKYLDVEKEVEWPSPPKGSVSRSDQLYRLATIMRERIRVSPLT
jgi:hypothetical protein